MPASEADDDEARKPPAKKARLEESAATEAPVLGQQRVRGKVVEWHGFFGWVKPQQELAVDVRPLLIKGEGRIYLNWRDVQPGLDIAVNVEVDFMLYEDENGLAASDVRAPGAAKADARAKVLNQLARKWADEDAVEGGESAEAADAADDGQVGEGPLLPGWTAIWSDEHECNYYWHTATKVAVWERPAMPAGANDEDQEEEESEPAAPPAATPMTPLVSQTGRAMTPVTPGAAQAVAARQAASHKGASQKSPTNGGSGIKPWTPQRRFPNAP